MTPSKACIDLISGFEGFSATAYEDGGGVWTLGFGTTKNVKAGDTCTKEQALTWLSEDVSEAAEAVNDLITVTLTQNQYDALVSFTYNVGSGHLKHSTLRDLLLKGDVLGAASQFLAWSHINGQISKGLMNRRVQERNLFMTPEAA